MTLILGDCINRMRELPEAFVDAVVTDPPYGLGFMGKDWDSPGGTGDFPMRRTTDVDAVNTGVTRQGGRQRTCDDFTKRQLRDARHYEEWCEAWSAEALRLLKPGGHLLAFGGTRTYHRLACGVEDAGFEIRDAIAWLYGSGFPKHHSLLKPALELLVIARKTGRGWLNTAAGTIPFQSAEDEREAKDKNRHADFDSGARENAVYGADDRTRAEQGNYDRDGRWPANVALDGVAAALLDEQTGAVNGGHWPAARPANSSWFGDTGQDDLLERHADRGGASRFFYCAKAHRGEREAGLDALDPKTFGWSAAAAAAAERGDDYDNGDGGINRTTERRNVHPTVKPIDLMRWLLRLAVPPGGTVLDPFMGSGTTGCAAALEDLTFTGIERDPDYLKIAEARIAYWQAKHVQYDLLTGSAA